MVGEPIDLQSLLFSSAGAGGQGLRVNAVVLRRQITDLIQQKLYELKSQADSLHREWRVRSPVAYRTL